ncbi:hypothetical protein NDN08_002179 [Rhodosorus marinus]|uniref:Uncharacterized protein n=1 Tax=Rhodosorus marinus TaxID=101924 RepID=A0AAV8UT36_9RHOD|nr:hypothetical protein NDN08_002179 [Rhodosorus marinus]
MSDNGSGKDPGPYYRRNSSAPVSYDPYPTTGSGINPNAYPEAGAMAPDGIEWKSAPASASYTRYPTPTTGVAESGGPHPASVQYPPPPGASEYRTPTGKAPCPPYQGYPPPNYPHANYPPSPYPPAQYPPPQYSQVGYPSTSSYGKEGVVNDRSKAYGANPGYPSGGAVYQSGEFAGYASTERRVQSNGTVTPEPALQPQSSALVTTASRRATPPMAHAASEPIPQSTYSKPVPASSSGTYYQSKDYVNSQYREEPKKKNVFASNKKAIGYGVAGAVLFGDVGGVAGAWYGHHKDKKKKKRDRQREGYYY